jgi:hypothetical protein
MFYQFRDILKDTLNFRLPSRYNFSTLIESPKICVPCVLDDNTYWKLSDDAEHVVQ